MNYIMQRDELDRISQDLLAIPPLIFRGVRRKLIKSTIDDFDVDITPLHFEMLWLLQQEGSLHISEAGSKLQIAKAQMTQIVDKLAGLQLLERITDKNDRRSINIKLTDRGSLFLKAHSTGLINSIRETISVLSDKELKEMSDSLRKMQDLLLKLQ